MLGLSRLSVLLDTDDNEETLKMVQNAIPSMVAVLKQAIDERDEDRTTQSFEVFQTLLSCDSSILNPHLGDLVQFMMNIAAEKDIDEDARTQALSFLMQCIRFRKLKMQGLKVGEQLTLKCLEISTELGDASDDEDVNTPRSALALLDEMATSLPPNHVVVPLLHALGPYVNSPDPDKRVGGIMALGMCVEGAPDFIATQMHEIFPLVLRLLQDSEVKVRRAALDGVMRIAEELPEVLGKEHQKLIPALIQHVDFAMKNLKGPEDKENLDIIKASAHSIDSLVEGLESDEIKRYLPDLMPRLSRLFTHPDLKVKGAAIGATGAVAGSAKDEFRPYFEQTMSALAEYVQMKNSPEELDLRSTTIDAMGSIAEAVGGKIFQRFVQPLMQATEEGLELDHPQLKETCYLFWAMMAKVYGDEFKPYLEGVLKTLFASIETEESDALEVDLGNEATDLAGKEVTLAGKKIKIADTGDDDLVEFDNIEDLDDEVADGDDDWDDLDVVTAVAQEKEIAVEVLGDILTHTTRNYLPYMEKTIEIVAGLLEHSFEGVQKSAVSTLFRAYTAVWQLQSDELKNFTPGLPLKIQPGPQIKKVGEVILTGVVALWQEEQDRYAGSKYCTCPFSLFSMASFEMMTQLSLIPAHSDAQLCIGEKTNLLLIVQFMRSLSVCNAGFQLLIDAAYRATVTEINRSIAATLKSTGPSLISDPNLLKATTSIVLALITKDHPCQKDFGDEEDLGLLDETSEYDWLAIDTALDVVIGLAVALGETFGQLWKIFEKPIMKFASASDAIERSTSVGVMAECIRAMGSEVTPSTNGLLKLLLHRMSDEDNETKSNAAYAVGLLQQKSDNDQLILKSFPTILSKLEPLLHTDEARAKDNAAGCVSRMITKHGSHVPITQVLPALVEILPLKNDFEENEPVYEMIVSLCKFFYFHFISRKTFPNQSPTPQDLLVSSIPVNQHPTNFCLFLCRNRPRRQPDNDLPDAPAPARLSGSHGPPAGRSTERGDP